MSWFQKPTEHAALEISMQFDMNQRRGIASSRWSFTSPNQTLSEEQLQVLLVSALYARMIVVQPSTREGLFLRVNSISRKLIVNFPGLSFDDWYFEMDTFSYCIWPWEVNNSAILSSPKRYKVSLLSTQKNPSLNYKIDMQMGLEKILSPSAPLIAIYSLLQEASPDSKSFFGEMLFWINKFFVEKGQIQLGDDSKAFSYAISNLAK